MLGQADATQSSDNEALISDTESVGDSEEQKINEQVKAINLNTAAASNSDEYSEEEEKKAEAFKTAGNDFFKGKQLLFGHVIADLFFVHSQPRNSKMQQSSTQRLSSARFQETRRQSCTVTDPSQVLSLRRTSWRFLMRARPLNLTQRMSKVTTERVKHMSL